MKTLLFVFSLLSCANFDLPAAPSLNNSSTVTVSWDANTESDLAGYKVYNGTTSGNYDKIIDVGNVTSVQLQASGIYFAVTAYDTAGNESGFSREVIFPDSRGPSIWDVSFVDSSIKTWEEIVLAIAPHNNETRDDNGWTIWGNGDGTDSGLFVLNPDKMQIKIKFDSKLIGYGICLDEDRELRIEGTVWSIGTAFKKVEFISNSDMLLINYSDDCWIQGESDANLRIENIKIFN